jgi:DNA-binding IclR family transcriptional regulator
MGSVTLRRLFAQHPKEIATAGLPTEWDAFRRYFAAIRKAGYYFSEGELESTLAAVAVPLQKADGHVLGALSLVTTVSRMAMVDRRKLTDLVKRTAHDIVSRIP